MPRNRNEEEPEFPDVWDESCRRYCRILSKHLANRGVPIKKNGRVGSWGQYLSRDILLVWEETNERLWYRHPDVHRVVATHMRYHAEKS